MKKPSNSQSIIQISSSRHSRTMSFSSGSQMNYEGGDRTMSSNRRRNDRSPQYPHYRGQEGIQQSGASSNNNVRVAPSSQAHFQQQQTNQQKNSQNKLQIAQQQHSRAQGQDTFSGQQMRQASQQNSPKVTNNVRNSSKKIQRQAANPNNTQQQNLHLNSSNVYGSQGVVLGGLVSATSAQSHIQPNNSNQNSGEHEINGSMPFGANNQVRNSKNRKLYTSIGAYNQNQKNQQQKMIAASGGTTVVQVPLINFQQNQGHQRNVIVSQQHSLGKGQGVNKILSQGMLIKSSSGSKGSNVIGIKNGNGIKNGKKGGNSSVLVVQQQQDLPGSYSTNNSVIIHGQSNDAQMAQAYQSMINNNQMETPNDMSMLSQASNVGGRKQNASQASYVNNSVIVERASDVQNLVGKKNKKSSKGQIQQDTGAWVVGSQKVGGGRANNNIPKVGNFVGSNGSAQMQMQEQMSNQGKKVTSNMIKAAAGAKTTQHQHFSQNQIHFMNNFSVDESVNSTSGQVHGNTTVMSHKQVMQQPPQQAASIQKQRPHSSFKAQTQKQINTYKQQLVNYQNGANGRGQHLLIGANGVVGISGQSGPAGTGNVNPIGGKGQRKGKHQVNIAKAKYGVSGATQQLNSMSVYQNDLVAEAHPRESRRMAGRGSSGVGGSGFNSNTSTGNDLSSITKEQREMRTSSATAGNTNTEFTLLNNPTGQGNQGPKGLKLNNQNQNYLLGGGVSATHAMSGASGISGLSGGAISAHTATAAAGIGGLGGTGKHLAPGTALAGPMLFNLTSGLTGMNLQSNNPKSVKQAGKSTKISKRNITANGALNFGNVTDMGNGGGQVLSSTNVSMHNNKKQIGDHQMALINQIELVPSGRDNRELQDFAGNRMGRAKGAATASSQGTGGYGINIYPANKYDQHQQAQVIAATFNSTGGSSKVNSHNQSHNQAAKTHQQSMQKFLQQQMTSYNTSGQGSKNSKKSKSKQINYNTTSAFNQQVQGYQGQGQGQGATAHTDNIYSSGKQSAQKLTKKQIIQQQNLLASDRLRGQQQRDAKEGARKGGTQTAIGNGPKGTVLNSSQIQINGSAQGNMKNAHGISRPRAASHNQSNKNHAITTVSASFVTRITPGGGANSVIGGGIPQQKIQALQSLPGSNNANIGILNHFAATSGTPGIQANAKVALLPGPPQNQRNYLSYVQNTNTSNGMQPFGGNRQEMANTSSSRRNKRGGTATLSSGTGAPQSANQVNRINLKRGTGASTGVQPSEMAPGFDFDVNSSLVQLGQYGTTQLPHLQSTSFDSNQGDVGPHMQIQIQIAEQAAKEMRLYLGRHKSYQYQLRPKSQNDAQNFELEDALSQDSKTHPGMVGRTLNNRCETSSPQVQEQEEKFLSAIQQHNNMDDTQTHGLDQSIVGNLNNTGIDKDQFLEIIQLAFEKIVTSLHPRIGHSLSQIRQMYDIYTAQLEQNHQQEQSQNAVQIQDLQACVTDLQLINQQLNLQLNQSIGQNSQLGDLASQNDSLVHQLRKTVKENQVMKEQLKHGNGREVGKGVIAQMKKDMNNAKGLAVSKDLDQLEKIRRAERQERTKESSLGHLDEMELNLRQKLAIAHQDPSDPLNLDGPIVSNDRHREKPSGFSHIGKKDVLGSEHIRIANGEIIQHKSRRGLDDADDEELSSIPSYAGNLNFEDRTRDNNTLGENGQMNFDDLDNADVLDLKQLNDLDIDDEDRRQFTGRNNQRQEQQSFDDQQSYFTSRVGESSSETIDSDLILAYQQAIAQGDSEPPIQIMDTQFTMKNLSATGPNELAPPLTAQDKSPIKVPALNFNIMNQNNYEENEMSQPDLQNAAFANNYQNDQNQNSEILEKAAFNITQNNQQIPPPMIASGNNKMQQPQELEGFQMKKKPKMPSLGLGLPLGGQGTTGAGGGFSLNLGALKQINEADIQQDFQSEFMAKVDEFSESWRNQLMKDKRYGDMFGRI